MNARPKVVTLSDGRIIELSSLACSRKHPGYAYGINDDPTSPDIFIIQISTGKTVGEINVAGAVLIDTEALDVSAGGNISLGAIGDNDAKRKSISMWVLSEPAKPEGKHTIKATEYRLAYPAGNRYNAETLVVHPVSGQKFIITKEFGVARIFAIPTTLTKSKVNILEPVGLLKLAYVTDASFTAGGHHLVLRQKGQASRISVVDWAHLKVLQPFDVTPVVKPEAIACEWASDWFIYGSEGKKSPLGRAELPEAYR